MATPFWNAEEYALAQGQTPNPGRRSAKLHPMMNDAQRQARWALEDWANGAGDEWKVIPAKEPGEACHLKWKGRPRDVLYCTVAGSTTAVLILEATPANLKPLRVLLSD